MSLRIILIVDDNEDSRIVFSIILQRAGFLTIVARDGDEGLHLAQAHLPDVVLADLHLPKLDGKALIARLRDSPRTASIPAILITADATAVAPSSTERFGTSEIVVKPCNSDELLDAIQRCLAPGAPSISQQPSVALHGFGGRAGGAPIHRSEGDLPCASSY